MQKNKMAKFVLFCLCFATNCFVCFLFFVFVSKIFTIFQAFLLIIIFFALLGFL